MRMSDFIEKKRNGGEHTESEINQFIRGIVSGDIPDYMTSAWLMAAFLRGLSHEETVALTLAMAKSGDMLDTSKINGITVDKHSTGGVGDKTSLIVGPIVVAAGAKVAKLSGRGLGITGGTVDKIASVPGCRVELSSEEFFNTVNDIGLCISAQSGNLAPADKILYALRDVTATVDSIPLIASSIMSKKLASGAECIVLDVKCGNGAFMKTPEKAKELADVMVGIGKSCGRKMAALVTDMSSPLGKAVGNAPEVAEAIEVLSGKGPSDTREICLALSSKMLSLAGFGSREECFEKAAAVLDNGEAKKKFAEFISAIGGNGDVVDNPGLLPQASVKRVVTAEKDGYIVGVDAELIGKASLSLGAGRETKNSKIDLSAGIVLGVKPRDNISKGDVLCELLCSDSEKISGAFNLAKEAFDIAETPSSDSPLILETVE